MEGIKREDSNRPKVKRGNVISAIFIYLVMILCVISGIKIGPSIYIGSVVLGKVSVDYNKIVVAVIFVISLWLSGKVNKKISKKWVRKYELFLTFVMIIAFLSYIVMR